jgi:beta-phosphoglucomutase-like phosphatase (HAD superfamily)
MTLAMTETPPNFRKTEFDVVERAQALILDCDGTLVATLPLHGRAWAHGLRCSGKEMPLARGRVTLPNDQRRLAEGTWNSEGRQKPLQTRRERPMSEQQNFAVTSCLFLEFITANRDSGIMVLLYFGVALCLDSNV